jgi:uncharacterized protein (DUF1684 family)
MQPRSSGFLSPAFTITFSGALLFLALVMGCGDGRRYHDEQPRQWPAGNDALADIGEFQASLNATFRDPEASPLPDRYRKNFNGLEFYPADTAFRTWARLQRTPEALPFDMPTSTMDVARERRYGFLTFELNGQPFTLEVYQSPDLLLESGYEDYLFLPFTDLTNGEGTYEGGRYLDLRIPSGDSLLLDFNKAYNPYCAYNPKYSCPIVPEENHLGTKITAGVKSFKK